MATGVADAGRPVSAACPLFGLVVTWEVRLGTPVGEAGAPIDDLASLLDTHGLAMSRRANDREILVTRDGSQATNADRELVIAWAKRWERVARIAVSDLVDLSGAD